MSRLIGLLFLLPNLLIAQFYVQKLENEYEVKFVGETIDYISRQEDNKLIFDFYLHADESKPGLPKLPSKTFFIAIQPHSKIEPIIKEKHITKFENVQLELNKKPYLLNDSSLGYETISVSQELFNKEFYPESEIEVLDYIWIRDFYCAVVKLNTHVYSFLNKSLYVIDSCTISFSFNSDTLTYTPNNSQLSFFDEMLKDVIINFEDAKKYRSFNPLYSLNDTTGNWIDYSREYVKLAIPNDNIYRITYNDLISYGINPTLINPMTFKLFRLGVEQPIFVYGQDDGVFDTTDYIEFYAEKNYSYQDYRRIVNIGSDYTNYMNRYTDTSFVWLTWGGTTGKRAQVINHSTISTQDTISSHLAFLHLERDVRLWYYDAVSPRVQLPMWQENKVFTWLFVGNGSTVSASFTARDFVPNTVVKTIARMISYASNISLNAHKFGISLNSTTVQDTINFNFRQTVNFTKFFNSSQLISGINNIRIFGLTSPASFHQALVDWIDVEYFRWNVAINDSILIRVPDTVQNSFRVIQVTGLSYNFNVLIYKIFPEVKRIQSFNFTGTTSKTIYFIDTVKGGDKYLIISLTKVGRPLFKIKKQFVNLRSSARGADYILITNKIFSSAEDYKNFISQNYGIRVSLVYNEDIFDEFSFGNPEAEAIKRFVVSAYTNWIPPKPSFLTLIGDANYDYNDIITPAPAIRKKNYLVSYGNPVSDVWFVMFDSVNHYFPQMFVGRIPVNSNQEIIRYLQRHQNYFNSRFSIFNKTFLFFSGGNANNPFEMAQIKATNDFVLNNFVNSSPIFGNAIHFYKTINPPSNFGPYSIEYVQSVIDEGGLFISYIGHSGTRTWDNSITEVEHLQNKYTDRFSLITDFGCSTGKFAEPDVDAFGELFITQSPYGQAIAYLGNSSWGYLSTSLRFPRIFYEILLRDTNKTIGRAHLLGKIRQINETGSGDINLVFTYCNLLLGDPIVGFKLPQKPNFYVDESSIKIQNEQINDQIDSINVKIIISNYGLVRNDSVKVLVEDVHADSVRFSKSIFIPFTKFRDTISLNIPTNKLTGVHNLVLKVDPDNSIDEIYEEDNQAVITYLVTSTSLTPIEVSNFYNGKRDFIEILNPLVEVSDMPEIVRLELSNSPDFIDSQTYSKNFDTLRTKVLLPHLVPNERYFYRLKFDHPNAFYSEINSFKQINHAATVFIDEPIREKDFIKLNVGFDSLAKSWKLEKNLLSLKILSGGGHDGAFGSIQYNSFEQLPNTYFWGLATALIDTLNLKPYSIRYFNVPDPGVMDSLANYLNSLPVGTTIAMTISADAVQNILGSAGSRSRNAIKLYGSKYIDSVQYRESWCILGKKGAPLGSVPESYKKLFTGAAQIEVSKSVTSDSGYLISPLMTNAKKWKFVTFDSEKPVNTNIVHIPIGITPNNTIDTLYQLQTTSDSLSLENIDANYYPTIKILSKFYSNQLKESPKLRSISAYYTSLPDLATNYQVVGISRDTIIQGEYLNYFARIFNIGKSSADSFKVTLELQKPDNSSVVLLDTLILSLLPDEFMLLEYKYANSLYDGYGNFSLKLTIDPENRLREFFKVNNSFVKRFFVKKDTTTSVSATALSVRFNGRELGDWDYVEPNSKINITMNYPIWFNVRDTAAVQIYIDGKRIYANEFNSSFDTIDRKLEIEFERTFEKGQHDIRIYIKDVYGRFSPYPTYEKYFKVSNDIEIQKVYNIPNPMKDGTYFTFVLTQIPDEATIKIYTVAGRLIKIIPLQKSDLSINFNKIYWDGRDEDGDMIGNGVYIYRLIVKKGDKTHSITQKIAVVR